MSDLDELLGSVTHDLRTQRRNIDRCSPSPEREQMRRDHRRVLEQSVKFLQRMLTYVEEEKHWPPLKGRSANSIRARPQARIDGIHASTTVSRLKQDRLTKAQLAITAGGSHP